MSFIFYQLSC